jgi:hypothetical protein
MVLPEGNSLSRKSSFNLKHFTLYAGQVYYYQPIRHIITDSNIEDKAVLKALDQALVILDKRVKEYNLILPQSTEIIFKVDIDQHPPLVQYYCVDHTRRIEFWLEEVTTERLGCPPVTSHSHLSKCFFSGLWRNSMHISHNRIPSQATLLEPHQVIPDAFHSFGRSEK